MDEVVRQALENVRGNRNDPEWSTMIPNQRASLIYQEMRRLDLETARSGHAPQPPVKP